MSLSQQAQEQLANLADHLEARREQIVHAWGQAVESDPRLTTAATLSRSQFQDHVPEIVTDFLTRLRARGRSDAKVAEQETNHDAAAHGRHRWQQGFHLRELMREWGHLHLVLLDEIEEYATGHPELDSRTHRAARRILAALCGEGVSESADQYFHLRQVEAAGNVRDLERTLDDWQQQVRQQGETWREAAHDLRGSLGVFRNVAFVLGQESLPDQIRADSVALLQRSVLSMQAMLEDVLSLARLQAGHEQRHCERFDAATLLSELCTAAEPQARERGLFLKFTGPQSLPVEGDEVKVQRIVQNLLLNALKYTQRGSVTVTWGDSGATDPQRWFLSVEDTGPGLHRGSDGPLARVLEKVTEEASKIAVQAGEEPPASPTPTPVPASVSHGTGTNLPAGEGIGLSIVKRLCELLDATLEVQSTPGVGTLFRVVLPRRYVAPG
jgi:signal transduction histidine kinase